MMAKENEKASWVTRNLCLLVLICQSVSISATATIPRAALEIGPLGYMVVYVLCLTLLGLPLVYMELIIGQFTGFNSLEVWQVRPCLSHIGHVVMLWQLIILTYNFSVASLVLRYFILSLGHVKEYARCGAWASKTCGITTINFTINQDCVASGPKYAYCDYLYTTYPETQFFRNMMGFNVKGIYVNWRLCLSSGLLCILLFLSSLMKKRSMFWFIGVLVVYPSVGFVLLFAGSMMQKGVVLHFPDAIDVAGDAFSSKFNFNSVVNVMVYCLTVGSGMLMDASSNVSFRAPCYANSVFMIATNVAVTVMTIFTAAMMTCPFAYEHSISTRRLMVIPLTVIFERMPAWLQEYDNSSFWLIVMFSSYTCFSIRKVVILFNNMLQIFVKRFSIPYKYYSLVTLAAVTVLFLITLPSLGNVLLYCMGRLYRRCIQLVSILIVIIEWCVFIVWYGLDRFCEDVHFMQGIRPGAYMKIAWAVSGVLLMFVLYCELGAILQSRESMGIYGLLFVGLGICYIVGVGVVKMVVAAWRQEAREALRLSAAWRPRSELLQRSRAMFTAQAMTKEYLYRQYHLQAAILARQQRANRTRVITLL